MMLMKVLYNCSPQSSRRLGYSPHQMVIEGPFGLKVVDSIFKTHNSNPKLKTPYSNLTITQKLQNTCLDSILSYISLQFFPKTVDPTTDTTECCLLLLPMSH